MVQGADTSLGVDEVTVLKEVVDSQSKEIAAQSQRIDELVAEHFART